MLKCRAIVTAWLFSTLASALLSGVGCSSLWSHSLRDDVFESRQLTLRGLDEMQRSEWKQAEKTFSQAISKCPEDASARRYYAETLLQRGAYDDAISHMVQAVRLSEDSAELWVKLGEMYQQRNRYAQAGRCANSAIRADNRYAPGWSLLGRVQHRQEQWDNALSSYYHALSLRPGDEALELAVVRIYRQLQQPHRALAMLSTLSARFPLDQTPVEILVEEGLALAAVGRYSDSVESLSAAASAAARDSPEILFELGRVQWLAGDPGNARLTLQEALRRTPNHRPCQELLAQLQKTDGRIFR